MQALFREIGPVLPVHGKVTLVFDDCFYRKRKAARDLMQLHAGSVSYTHLDVYKRQTYIYDIIEITISSKRWLQLFCGEV